MKILSTKSSPSTGILVFVQPEPNIDLGLQILQRHPGRNLWGERVQFLLWYRATLSLLCKLSLFGQSKFYFHLVFFPSFFPSNFLLEILNFLSFWNKMESDVVFKAMFQFCKLGRAPKEPLLRGPKRPQKSPDIFCENMINDHILTQWSLLFIHDPSIFLNQVIVHCTLYNVQWL